MHYCSCYVQPLLNQVDKRPKKWGKSRLKLTKKFFCGTNLNSFHYLSGSYYYLGCILPNPPDFPPKVRILQIEIFPQNQVLNPPDLRKSSESGSTVPWPAFVPLRTRRGGTPTRRPRPGPGLAGDRSSGLAECRGLARARALMSVGETVVIFSIFGSFHF